MHVRFAAALLGLVMLAGTALAADWRETIGSFRVGFVAAGNPTEATARLEPFRLALAEGLGLDVELFAGRDYATLVDALVQSRIEYAILSATAHALAEARCQCIEPVAIARDGDGAIASRQVLIVRADGPAALADLKGKRIGALHAGAFGGLDIALDGLAHAGLDLGGNEANLQWFDSGAALLAALTEARIDAAIGWSPDVGTAQAPTRGTLAQAAALGADPAAFRTIWQSVEIPNRIHSVRQNLPGEAKARLRELLPAMFSDDPVAYDLVEPDHGGGFVIARPSQIEPLLEVIRRLREGKEAKP